MSLSFPSTRWTLILARRRSPEPDESEQLRLAGELCRDYWKPVYSYLRASGYGREDAEDLTQGFFASALEAEFFEQVDPTKGRLRSYLLGAVKHYVINEKRRKLAEKRGGLIAFVSLDTKEEERTRSFRIEPAASGLSPDLAFDRRWAECLLAATLVRIREEYTSVGKGNVYEALRPLLDGSGEIAVAAAALALQDGAVRIALHRFRRRYREMIKAEIGATLAPGLDVSDEFNHLLMALSDEKSQ